MQLLSEHPVDLEVYAVITETGGHRPLMQASGIQAPWSQIAHPLMSCWYWVYGPVGLYWVLPMFIAMYLDNWEWFVLEEDPNNLNCGGNVGQPICPGLPKYCATVVWQVPNKEWKQFYDLHKFLMTYQACFFLMDIITIREKTEAWH